jgi:hypothetical protein
VKALRNLSYSLIISEGILCEYTARYQPDIL